MSNAEDSILYFCSSCAWLALLKRLSNDTEEAVIQNINKTISINLTKFRLISFHNIHYYLKIFQFEICIFELGNFKNLKRFIILKSQKIQSSIETIIIFSRKTPNIGTD
ncbi:hypothetical protein BpHYR1_015487 [Brachionus plicatilis]|uniref:Uncharacterized protein n=1 Tax=Brachionus plicatilis TaxID=10195 RepID=A0A3M7T0F5_BRAPC|nr:hypothetical protein BpHYR1_015487 [Brachionus plicatilis]